MNPARQFLHILLKDIRRHALEIGLVLLLNVVLTLTLTQPWSESLDSRSNPDWNKRLFGDAAQVLLVVAWCALIGRVVQGDGIAGKTPYWLTRPYARPVLLASKLSFVLLFVHVPLFLSHLMIVTGSGLPLSFAQILADQAVLAACMSLPVMALATLTTGFTRFVFVGVAVAAVATFSIAGSPRNPLYAIAVFTQIASNLFLGAVLAILASIAIVALVCQYRWRSTLRVAVWSVVALSLLGLGTLTLPTLLLMRVRAAIAIPTTVAPTIRFEEERERFVVDPGPAYPVFVFLPIDVTATGESSLFTFGVDVRSTTGREVELSGASLPDAAGADIRRRSDGSSWLVLRLAQSDYDSLKADLVSVHFIAEVETYDIREMEPIPRDLSAAIVGGRAQCGIPSGRSPFTCRTAFGWSLWSLDTTRGEAGTLIYEMSLPVRLRFAIDPILTQVTGNSDVAAVLRRRVSYTRQDVTFENIRLGDWGP